MLVINQVILKGNICFDPEIKYVNDKTRTKFRLAVPKYVKKDDEHWDADFFDIVCWDNTAAFASEYLKKGDGIIVIGELHSYTFSDNNNVVHYKVEVKANKIEALRKINEKKKNESNTSIDT